MRCATQRCHRKIHDLEATAVVVVRDSKTGAIKRAYCSHCGSKSAKKPEDKRMRSSWVAMSMLNAKNYVKQN